MAPSTNMVIWLTYQVGEYYSSNTSQVLTFRALPQADLTAYTARPEFPNMMLTGTSKVAWIGLFCHLHLGSASDENNPAPPYSLSPTICRQPHSPRSHESRRAGLRNARRLGLSFSWCGCSSHNHWLQDQVLSRDLVCTLPFGRPCAVPS